MTSVKISDERWIDWEWNLVRWRKKTRVSRISCVAIDRNRTRPVTYTAVSCSVPKPVGDRRLLLRDRLLPVEVAAIIFQPLPVRPPARKKTKWRPLKSTTRQRKRQRRTRRCSRRCVLRRRCLYRSRRLAHQRRQDWLERPPVSSTRIEEIWFSSITPSMFVVCSDSPWNSLTKIEWYVVMN